MLARPADFHAMGAPPAGQRLLSATLAAACTRGIQSGPDPLVDQVALEFGQGAEYVKDQLTAARRGVVGFAEALQPGTRFLQRFGAVDKILQGSPRPVQPPCGQVSPSRNRSGSLGPGAACLVIENPIAPDRTWCVMLQIQFLFFLRYARVANEHA